MYKVILSDEFWSRLEKFIRSYSLIFEKLYTDTWIENEHIIVENYKRTAEQFKKEILKELFQAFSEKLVFGRKINSDNTFSFILYERSFVVIIHYTEDTHTQTRYLETILFTKK